MLPYAQAVFAAVGFGTSHAEFKHAPLPFVPLGEDFDKPMGNGPKP
jgi:hypothetical protein